MKQALVLFKSLLCQAFCHYPPTIILINTVYLSQISFYSYIPCFVNSIASNLGIENGVFPFSLSLHDTSHNVVSPAVALIMLLSFLARIIQNLLLPISNFIPTSIQCLCFAMKMILLQIKSLILSFLCLIHLMNSFNKFPFIIYQLLPDLLPAYVCNHIVQISIPLPMLQPHRISYRNSLGFFMLSWELFDSFM